MKKVRSNVVIMLYSGVVCVLKRLFFLNMIHFVSQLHECFLKDHHHHIVDVRIVYRYCIEVFNWRIVFVLSMQPMRRARVVCNCIIFLRIMRRAIIFHLSCLDWNKIRILMTTYQGDRYQDMMGE